MKVLFLSYDGLTDPLGQSQILPYLIGLSQEGHQISILSCEKRENLQQQIEATKQACENAKLIWHYLPYPEFSNPLQFLLFFRTYLQKATRLIQHDRPELLHCRSYPAALAAYLLKKKLKLPWIFDMRGFWIDERIEGGIWHTSNPLIFILVRILRMYEKRLFPDAAAIISLTKTGQGIVQERFLKTQAWKTIRVIPCATDFGRYPGKKPVNIHQLREKHGLPAQATIITYLGSLGTWYLLDEMLRFFKIFIENEKEAIFLFVTREIPGNISSASRQHGIPPEAVRVIAPPQTDIPEFICLSDWGIAFIKPCFSKQASSPVKWAELLAGGTPMIVNAGIGDLDTLQQEIPAFVVVPDFSDTAYRQAINQMDSTDYQHAEKIQSAAARFFDLTAAIDQYHQVYQGFREKRLLYVASHRPGRAPNQRFRFEQYIPYLESNGYACESSFLITEKDDRFLYAKGHWIKKAIFLYFHCWLRRYHTLRLANGFDIILIAREALMTRSTFFERALRRKTRALVFDFDDSIWLPNISKHNRIFALLKNPAKTARIIAMADLVIAGNNYLADYAREFNPNLALIPTTVDTNSFIPRVLQKESSAPVVIGWTGSLTTIEHFKWIEPILLAVKKKFGPRIVFRVIGSGSYYSPGLETEGLPWSLDKEKAYLADFDIGIMPLPNNDWTKGKCGFKGLLCMAMGIPVIMSPVGVNTAILRDGENGFLAATPEEWVEKLSLLILDKEKRYQMGQLGRQTVVSQYSTTAWEAFFLHQLNTLITSDGSLTS